MVDWSGASVTEETLERTEVSEAAHRTPPKGRWPNGNQPLTLQSCFSAVDILFICRNL